MAMGERTRLNNPLAGMEVGSKGSQAAMARDSLSLEVRTGEHSQDLKRMDSGKQFIWSIIIPLKDRGKELEQLLLQTIKSNRKIEVDTRYWGYTAYNRKYKLLDRFRVKKESGTSNSTEIIEQQITGTGVHIHSQDDGVQHGSSIDQSDSESAERANSTISPEESSGSGNPKTDENNSVERHDEHLNAEETQKLSLACTIMWILNNHIGVRLCSYLDTRIWGSVDFGNRRRKIAKFPPIPTVLTPVRPRSTTAKHRRCPEPSPASIPALTTASKGENRGPQRGRRCSRRSRPPAS
ncbi:hypothetical protein CRG98_042657 [Punica granatum]|uniref:Uncharacterized protein n=1 Tax=Punica granatum TaxID=22663 RepID=A0A2I0I0F5_PUNGR|nr:hypothetical protein CRG98_042657 [Punica granatum]